LVLVAVKEQEAVLTELESALPAILKDDHMQIETQMSHSMPASGDGEALAQYENRQGEIPELPCKEVMTPEQEGCDGGGGGGGVGKTASLPEFLPVPEDNEPAWGDVPDEIPVEPIAPPRPPKRPRVAPECVEVDDVVQTMRNILFNL
jgi:hypothetical protein